MIERLKNTLKNAGHSVTKTRCQIFDELAKNAPVTAADLANSCSNFADRATVYRTIELFETLGIINRIWHGFKSRLELSEVFTPHHHHAICQRCNQITKIIDPDLEKTLARISKEYQFLAITHVIELSGYCKNCQIG